MARTIKRAYARYTESFKAEAVRLASQPGILVQDVAQSLDIHPFMLSRWKKQVREGLIMVNQSANAPELVNEAELLRLREVEKAYAQLKLEHDLLKKVIKFTSDVKRTSSVSSPKIAKISRSK
ncbi:MAG: transposase [Thermodesulfovibrionales bacterium]|nr:transposase [Thermodesulfovibrionales bacterium]